jgi:hypothetical protein
MPFQKEKSLPSGVSGNYWAVSNLNFRRAGMVVELEVSLYKDNTPGLAPLGLRHKFSFVITPQEIQGNLITWAHSKILAYANSDIPNIDGEGTHKGCADLVGAVVVA